MHAKHRHLSTGEVQSQIGRAALSQADGIQAYHQHDGAHGAGGAGAAGGGASAHAKPVVQRKCAACGGLGHFAKNLRKCPVGQALLRARLYGGATASAAADDPDAEHSEVDDHHHQ
jgi:hypothetical protein